MRSNKCDTRQQQTTACLVEGSLIQKGLRAEFVFQHNAIEILVTTWLAAVYQQENIKNIRDETRSSGSRPTGHGQTTEPNKYNQ
jgi:hypothetical protein